MHKQTDRMFQLNNRLDQNPARDLRKDDPMKLDKVAKKALDLLPLDGHKTELSMWGVIYGIISGTGVAGLPIPIGVTPLQWIVASAGGVAIGLAHKWLKKKYPDLKLPILKS